MLRAATETKETGRDRRMWSSVYKVLTKEMFSSTSAARIRKLDCVGRTRMLTVVMAGAHHCVVLYRGPVSTCTAGLWWVCLIKGDWG